jgi:hypothetical protein
MATKKTGSPTFPTVADVRKVLLAAQLEVNNNPARYFDYDFDEDGHNAIRDMRAAKRELHNRLLHEYIDSCLEDEGLFHELTDDLPDGPYSDDQLEEYVAEYMEETFIQENGRADDLDENEHWDELLKIDPRLVGYVGPDLYLSVTSAGKLCHELANGEPNAAFDRSPHRALTRIFYCPTGEEHEGYDMGASLAARNYLDPKPLLAELKKVKATHKRRGK